jgi:choline dehydrogenase-like flavoprotein
MAWRPVGQAPAGLRERPVVVGFGPCGIFAALVLAQMGLRPIVLERGKTVRERTKDTWGLWRKRVLNPESNVQFGEGGAGTFSDGKLYSQIKDPRHLGRKVMEEFVKAGAPPEILYVAHPHIGTFKLVKVVENAARADHRAGRRDPLPAARDRCADRAGQHRPTPAGLTVLDQATGQTHELPAAMWCWRWATARATPLPCCTSAACTWRPSRFRSAFASSTRRA